MHCIVIAAGFYISLFYCWRVEMSEGGFFFVSCSLSRFNHNFLILSLVFRYDIQSYVFSEVTDVNMMITAQWELTTYVDNHSAEIGPSLMRWICFHITSVWVRKSWLRDNTIVMPFKKKTKVHIEWLCEVFSIRNQWVPCVAVTAQIFHVS